MALGAAEITKFEADIDAGLAQSGGTVTGTATALKDAGTALRSEQATLTVDDRGLRDSHDKIVEVARILGANSRATT